MKLKLEELKAQAIQSVEDELNTLNDFAENEGHHNTQVMLAVVSRIASLEMDLEMLKRKDTAEHEVIYQSFWKKIVAPDGRIVMDQVKKELADYKVLLEEVPKVYDELAGLSKPHTAADVIISRVNDRMIDKQTAFDDLSMGLKGGKVTISVEDLKRYFNIS